MNEYPPMTPGHLAPRPSAPKKTGFKKVLLIVFIVLGLSSVVVVGLVGYRYGSTSKSKSVTNSSKDLAETAPSVAQTEGGAFHTVLSEGHVATGQKVVVSLAIPSRLQAITVQSTNRDPGYTNSLTDGSGEEVGRWIFGNPAMVGPYSVVGELAMFDVGHNWLSWSTTVTDPSGRAAENIIHGYNFTTPKDKVESLEKLEIDTKECVEDPKTGFVMSETINVCYEVKSLRQSVGVYRPALELQGYGLVDNQRYILFGSLDLIDREYGADRAHERSWMFNEGDMPEETMSLLNEYVDALQNSKVVVGN